jgi:hypothetical protein
MNTVHYKDEVRHRIPGAFYFFNVTEYAYMLEIHLMYAHEKEYRFKNHLTNRPDCVKIYGDGI